MKLRLRHGNISAGEWRIVIVPINNTDRRKQIYVWIAGLICAVLLVLFIPLSVRALTAEDAAVTAGRGWYALPSGRFTYITKSLRPAVGFLKLKNRYYHFDGEGYLSVGWFTEQGVRYYATPGGKLGKKKGSLKSGYVKAGAEYCLFISREKKGAFGAQELGWVTVSKKVFFYDEGGSKLTGLQEINGKLYYFIKAGSPKNIGRLKTGWKTINGRKYYFRTSGKTGKNYGAAYRGKTVTIRGKKYTFTEDGYIEEEQAVTTKLQKEFIEKIGAMAHADMLSTGVLASVTVAQAIIESGWGTSTLAKEANNLFGMKSSIGSTTWKSAWDGAVYNVNTQEYVNGKYITIKAGFRKYPNIQASVADHSAYLTGAKLSDGSLRYNGLIGCRDYEKAATIIKNGGYATAPNYVSALVDVIKKYNLDQFDKV